MLLKTRGSIMRQCMWHIIHATIIVSGMLLLGCDSYDERKEIRLDDVINGTQRNKQVEKQFFKVIRFGFDRRSSIEEDTKQYYPFLKYLEKATGYKFKLYFKNIQEDAGIVDDLGMGIVDFAAIGAGSYIKAQSKYRIILLVRGLNSEGKAEYQSMIIVKKNSPIKRIEDLQGKHFAFGSITSTQGHLIPRILLHKHGIKLEDLADYQYMGSHQNCANAVITGQFDAGGIQDTLAKDLVRKRMIKILYTSEFFPSSGIAANKNVPPEVISGVKQALLDFQPKDRDRAKLYHWERTEMPNGFVEAKPGDYKLLADWAEKFRILKDN